MKDLNWLLAAKRAYYAIWGAATVWLFVFGVINLVNGHTPRDIFMAWAMILLVPYGVLKSAQWVYKGLITKS